MICNKKLVFSTNKTQIMKIVITDLSTTIQGLIRDNVGMWSRINIQIALRSLINEDTMLLKENLTDRNLVVRNLIRWVWFTYPTEVISLLEDFFPMSPLTDDDSFPSSALLYIGR